MSKLRIRQMMGVQVPSTVKSFELPLENKRNGSGSGGLLEGDLGSLLRGNRLKKTQTLREEILKKTARIGSPGLDLYKPQKPSLRLLIQPGKLKKKKTLLDLGEDWKSLSPKNYFARKDSKVAVSGQDLLTSRKEAFKNPLLSKVHRTKYKTRKAFLEKTKKSLLSKINSNL